MNHSNAYIFASSNLRAKEKTGSAAERLAAFANAHSEDDLFHAAAKAWNLSEAANDAQIFDMAMAEAVRDINSVVPEPSVFAPLLYKYDCTNVKLAIKYRILGESAEGKLLECGSISPTVILDSQKNGNWSPLPAHMKKAAQEAESLYKKTGEARIIDITLDVACFLDMKADAEKHSVSLIKEIVVLRSDSINLLSAMRLAPTGDTALFERVFLPTGNISCEIFIKNGAFTELGSLYGMLSDSPVKKVLKAVCDGNLTIAETERLLDEAVLSLTLPTKLISYGPEVAVRYLLVREAEITNCRIIHSTLTSGNEDMRERMRRSYV